MGYQTIRLSALSAVIITLLFFSCTPGVLGGEERNGDDSQNGDQVGYAFYSHQIPCGYVRLEGLKARESGFGIEPHALKNNQRRYVLMLDYDFTLLRDSEDKAFRESTGEKNGKFLDHDADGPGMILCHWLDGITITSSEDFNGIPSGESLASKIMLLSWSVWPSVKAGKDIGHSKNDLYCQYLFFNPIPDFPCYSYIAKQLDSLSEDDLYLLAADRDRAPVMFLFTELPAQGQHVFTITYTEGDRQWYVDIPADFDAV